MSQFNINVIPEVDDGVSLSEQINQWRDAVHSGHIGPQRPSYAVAGTVWIDNSVAGGWKMYVYDGTNDIPLPGPIQSTGAGAGGAIAYMEGFNNQYAAFGSASSHPTVIATNKTEVARFTQAGDFGVGTNNPTVRGDFHGVDYTAIRAYTTTNGVDTRMQSLSSGVGFLGTVSNHPTAVMANNVEAIRVMTNGNVGIGTTAPAYKLQVNQPTLGNTVGNRVNALRLESNTGNGDSLDVHWVRTSSVSGWNNADVFIRRNVDGSEGQSAIAFGGENSVKFYSNSAERARLDADGNFMVGATSINTAISQSGVRLFNRGKAQMTSINETALDLVILGNVGPLVSFSYGPTLTGTITTNGASTSYNTTSDYRLKENVAPMTGALEKVAALKPCTYTWKVDGSAGQGFIAHELQAVVPDCVTGEKDAVVAIGNVVDAEGNVTQEGVTEPDKLQKSETWTKTGERPVYQGIDTSFLVATLVAAIQELTAKVAALEAK
jgi:hypothetical protein